MAIANKLGESFIQNKEKIKIKTIHIEIEEQDIKFELKVRIPLKAEIEEITNRIMNPDESKIDKFYKEYTAELEKTIEENGEEFLNAINSEKAILVKTDNDIIVDGNSLRQFAKLTIMDRTRVEEYFHLLKSEIDSPVNETYEQIIEELPEAIVKLITSKIEDAIKPDYNAIKKD